MASVSHAAFQQAIAAVPVLGSPAAGIYGAMLLTNKENEDAETTWEAMIQLLPAFLSSLDKHISSRGVNGQSQLVSEVRARVESFNDYVQARRRTTWWSRHKVGQRGHEARESVREFKRRYAEFMSQFTQFFPVVVELRTLQLTEEINSNVRAMRHIMDAVLQRLPSQRGSMRLCPTVHIDTKCRDCR